MAGGRVFRPSLSRDDRSRIIHLDIRYEERLPRDAPWCRQWQTDYIDARQNNDGKSSR